jgi:outer membrane lipoprotein-sorting protein
MRIVCTNLLLVVLASRLSGQQAKNKTLIPQDPLDHAVATYDSMRTLRAQFLQVNTHPLTGLVDSVRGEIFIERPDKFSIRYSYPGRDRVVDDREYLWSYAPGSAETIVVRQRGGGWKPLVIGWSLMFLTNPRPRYMISYQGPAGAEEIRGARLVIINQTDRDRLPTARVWVDDTTGLARRVEIHQLNRVTSVITFSRVVLNAPLPPSTFKFVVPKGAKLVTIDR